MTRLEALTQLRDKVKAEYSRVKVEEAAFAVWQDGGDHINAVRASAAFYGSLDAAKALHEAVLHERVFVEIHWSKRYEDESRVSINLGRDGWVASSDTLARAWLLAILEALIAQEQNA